MGAARQPRKPAPPTSRRESRGKAKTRSRSFHRSEYLNQIVRRRRGSCMRQFWHNFISTGSSVLLSTSTIAFNVEPALAPHQVQLSARGCRRVAGVVVIPSRCLSLQQAKLAYSRFEGLCL